MQSDQKNVLHVSALFAVSQDFKVAVATGFVDYQTDERDVFAARIINQEVDLVSEL